MALLGLLLMVLLSMVIAGGLVARDTVSGVKLTTVPGALLGFVGLCQFVLYLFAVIPISIVLFFVTVEEDARHRAFGFSHSFELRLPETALEISDVQGFAADATVIESLQARMSVAGSDGVVTSLLVAMSVSLWILVYLLLRHARAVMRSLYDRTPFIAENSKRLRYMAWHTLGIWFVYSVYALLMTAYLQSVLEVSGGELLLADLPVVTPLLIAGLLIVLAEVFRVGFELKEENAFTV